MEVAKRLSVLVEAFTSASKDWPNLESHLICWPSDKPAPEVSPQPRTRIHLKPSGRNKDGVLVLNAGKVSADCLNSIVILLEDGFLPGMGHILKMQRTFGYLGKDPVKGETEDCSASSRWTRLAEFAIRNLAQSTVQLPAYCKCLKSYDAWPLFLHQQSSCEWRQLRDYPEEYQIQVIGDVFLESALLIESIIAHFETKGPTPNNLGLIIDEGARKITRDGKIVSFAGKGKAWELFLGLLRAKDLSATRNELFELVWGGKAVSESNADMQKSKANDLLSDIRIEISADNRGIWRLSEY